MLRPRDAETRLLLGRAYLATGRFTSAEAAFLDALMLDPSLTRAGISRALAQIALGRPAAARASLAVAQGHADDADIGLALALLGDKEEALNRLNTAARAAGADGRTRQNLGLAYALDGRWVDAVAIAEQDVPADVMPQRLRRWAMIAQLKADPAMLVGAMLGVLPVADGGQPKALALVVPSPVAEIPVVLAAAPPSPPPFIALVAPVVVHESGSVVTAISFAPPPLDALVATPTATPPAPPEIAAVAPEIAAWAGPPRMRKPRAVGMLARRPIVLASYSVSKRAAGHWAVQLGAFSSEQRTRIAWGRLSGQASFLNAYTPASSGRRWGKAMLHRLSVGRLSTRKEAIGLCARIKANGGKCFVRNMHGDWPTNWALRTRPERPV